MGKQIVERLKYYGKSGLIDVFGANVINKVIAMLSNMVITRLLSKTDYGIWSYVLNIYSYLALISGLGLLSGAFQFGAENKGNEKEFQYYKYCGYVGLAADIGLLALFMVGTLALHLPFPSAGRYLRAYFPVVIIDFVLQLFLTVLRCENRIKEYARTLNINTILIAGGTCIGALKGVDGIIVCKYAAYFISCTYILLKSKPELKKILKTTHIKREYRGELWHYSVFTGISSMLNGLVYLIDVSMVAQLISNEIEVANYKVATLIPNALNFIPASLVIFLLPNFIYNRNNRQWVKQNIKKTFLYVGVINLIICVSSAFLAPLIITIISGRQYLESVDIFRILIVEYFFSGTFRYLSCNFLSAFKRVTYGLFISISSVIMDILLNFALISRFSTIGAAYATLLSVILTSALAFGYLAYIIHTNLLFGGHNEENA